MNEYKHSIEFVAMNLTKTQFAGFCEGMALVYIDRASKKKKDHYAVKSVLWWEGAYSKYNHHCDGSE